MASDSESSQFSVFQDTIARRLLRYPDLSSGDGQSGSELDEFASYLASEAWLSLPDSLKTATFEAKDAVPDVDDVSLDATSAGFVDTLISYGIVPDHEDALKFLRKTLVDYVEEACAPPPVWSSTRTAECEICLREVRLTYHHLIPKSTHAKVLKRGWHHKSMLNSVAWLCSGPSAFYVASRVLKLIGDTQPARIHLYDKLFAPYGLVRYGVAPDHPEVKNCTHKFAQTASDPRFRFFGNVEVLTGSSATFGAVTLPNAQPLSLRSLFESYTHVVFATGCGQPRLHSALPPNAPWCVPALDIVHWYTQHPSRASAPPPPLANMQDVTLIGNGNVSLDIARLLLTPVSHLSRYDIPQHVLDILAASRINHVSIIARRGPLEAAFTMKELREMMEIPGGEIAFTPLAQDLLAEASQGQSLVDEHGTQRRIPLTRQQKRMLDLLHKGSKVPHSHANVKKTWDLQFFQAPTGYTVNTSPPSSSLPVTLNLARTTLTPSAQAALTSHTTTHQTSMIVTSLGFVSSPQTPFYEPSLGRLRTHASSSSPNQLVSENGQPVPRVYASGWAAMGAKGVLGSTMMDAFSVAEQVVGDWRASNQAESARRVSTSNVECPLHPSQVTSSDLLDAVPREVEEALGHGGLVTEYSDWQTIDQEEIRRGDVMGKERERMGWEAAKGVIKRC